MAVVAEVQSIEFLDFADDQGEIRAASLGGGKGGNRSLEFVGDIGVPLVQSRGRFMGCEIGPSTGRGRFGPSVVRGGAVRVEGSRGPKSELQLAAPIIEMPTCGGGTFNVPALGAAEIRMDAQVQVFAIEAAKHHRAASRMPVGVNCRDRRQMQFVAGVVDCALE